METNIKKSKKLAYLLRHSKVPDIHGFVPMRVAMDFCAIDKETLLHIVHSDSKNRFEIVGDKIRACYGHSGNKINPGFERCVPPSILYHGTTDKAIASIELEGLKSQKRNMVHLSDDLGLAFATASRHKTGEPVLLKILALAMHEAGFEFYKVGNGIWNVDKVPPQYILC